MDLVLAVPRGFCAGVVRAIEIVKLALEAHGPPVYVYHEIVHNNHVVRDLQNQGAIFVESLDCVPPGALTVFSAHGVSNTIIRQASERGLEVIDATCPLVMKVHLQAQRFSNRGCELIIIGHPGHEEVVGTMGAVDGPVQVVSCVEDVTTLSVSDVQRLAYVTQTTLSIDDTRGIIRALKQRFPAIQGPDLNDICYATQNRQNAVQTLARDVDLLLVVGARNSSNSNRLREVAERCGLPAYLIEDERKLNPDWLDGVTRTGVTAGASTPEVLVERVVNRLRDFGVDTVTEMNGLSETASFRLPQILRSHVNASRRPTRPLTT